MHNNINQKPALSYILIIFTPIIGLAVGFGLSSVMGLGSKPVGNLIVNVVFFVAVLLLIPIFKFSLQELGLKVNRSKLGFHIVASLVIFLVYVLFYIFVIRISTLKPIDSTMVVNLVTYFIVVLAEELYFRGQLYSFFEKRFSASTALAVSALLFGIFHARQGLGGVITKTITGTLWGSVRYTTGMIFLLIFPVHFAFNATWLLFEGNWNTPPAWATYSLPITELVLTLTIFVLNRIIRTQKHTT